MLDCALSELLSKLFPFTSSSSTVVLLLSDDSRAGEGMFPLGLVTMLFLVLFVWGLTSAFLLSNVLAACSTSPAVVPAAAATAAAAAVTEAGAVVCLLPTVKSPIPSHVEKESYKEGEQEVNEEQGIKMGKGWSDI